MDVRIMEMSQDTHTITKEMITKLMNYHRKLNNAPKKYWQTDEQSQKTLSEWIKKGKIYNIYFENKIVGFFYVKFGGQNAAWLEDLFITKEYRGMGIGKLVMSKLDELMLKKKVAAMFVNVIPRNIDAMKMYLDCGFDHLNMIQLRKNYDKELDKEDEVEILGFNIKKY